VSAFVRKMLSPLEGFQNWHLMHLVDAIRNYL